MKKQKTILLIPIAAAIALVGTGFGAWVFSSGNTVAHTGANIEVADAYSYDNLKVDWIDNALILNQNAEHTGGAEISPLSFTVSYTAEIGIGGTNTYIPDSNGGEGNYSYSQHTDATLARTMVFSYTVKILKNKLSDYVIPSVSVTKKDSGASYSSTTDVDSISIEGDTITVYDKVAVSATDTTVNVEDLVTIDFTWNNVPSAIDNSSTKDAFNYQDLKSKLSGEAPLTFIINTDAPAEETKSEVNLDMTQGGTTFRNEAAATDNIIFGKLSDYQDIASLTSSQYTVLSTYKIGKDVDSSVWGYIAEDKTTHKTTTFILSNYEIVLTSDDIRKMDMTLVDPENEVFHVTAGLFSDFNIGYDENGKAYYIDNTNISNLKFSNLDTSELTSGDNMFYFLTNLKTIDLTGFDTSSMTSMMSMFCGCSSLTTLDITSFDTSNVTNFVQMFAGCSKLETINVSSSFVINEEITTAKVGEYDSNGNVVDNNYADTYTYAQTTNSAYMFAYDDELKGDGGTYEDDVPTTVIYKENGKVVTDNISSHNAYADAKYASVLLKGYVAQ